MGVSAMAVVMLRLPLTSVLLAAILFPSDALTLLPLVIAAVVVAHVVTARLTPNDTKPAAPAGPAAAEASPRTDPSHLAQ